MVVEMRLSNQVGTRSNARDSARSVDNSWFISETLAGSNSAHFPWNDDWGGCCGSGRTNFGDLVDEALGEVVSAELVGGRLSWRL